MTQAVFRPDHLDVRAFAQAQGQLSGTLALSQLPRLGQDLYQASTDCTAQALQWQARGQGVRGIGGVTQSWLHLQVSGSVPLQCQRCLGGMQEHLQLERSFRFVRDEADAMEQDEDAQEDLLVASKQFNLLELIEDELILALPFAPSHLHCPVPVTLQASSADFEAALNAKPQAFASLGTLQLSSGDKT